MPGETMPPTRRLPQIRADDSLDVLGVHAVGGIFGALMTGIFNAPALGGPGSTVDWVKGVREEEEREGLDITSHGERA
jgi:ammonia channel protein AmtB